MKPTRWYVLVLVGVLAAGLGYLITRSTYTDLPSPTLYAQISLFAVAIAEGYTAGVTKARLEGKHGTRPVNPIFVARLVALAKASSLVGVLAAGAYAGFLGYVVQIDSTVAHRDVRTAAVGVIAGLSLMGAALYLEWIGRVKAHDDDGERA